MIKKCPNENEKKIIEKSRKVVQARIIDKEIIEEVEKKLSRRK